MARLRHHTPIVSWATAPSEKQDKQPSNRRCRAALRDVSAPWCMAKDGHQWIGTHVPKLMRK